MLKTPSFSDFNVIKHSAVLSNGVRVTLFERPKTPITVQLSFLSGSRFDPVGKEGLAHFTEHMVTAGTKKFPSSDVMASFIQGLGGSYNASTGIDVFRIYVSLVESEDFPKAVDLINEIINYPLFNSKIVETERGAVLRELDRREANPNVSLQDISHKLFLQNTLCGRFMGGYKETVELITKEDIVSYYNAMLTSGRAGITIGGGIGMDEVMKGLESGLIMHRSDRFVVGDTLPVIRNKAVEIKRYTTNDQLNINFGFRVCARYTEDEIPLILLGNIMGGGFASALYKKLRFEKGLVYTVGAGYGGSIDRGSFTVTTEISKKNLPEVLDIIGGEFERAVFGKITSSELDFFKTRKIKSQKRVMETSDSWVGFHAYDELFGNEKRLSLPEFLEKVNQVTLDDITRVSKKYLAKDSWYLAVCGDIEEKDIVVHY